MINQIFKRCVTAAISGKETRTLPIFAPGILGQAQDRDRGVILAYPGPGSLGNTIKLAPRSLVLENVARRQTRLPRGKAKRPDEDQSES